jgi:hypothetical protein
MTTPAQRKENPSSSEALLRHAFDQFIEQRGGKDKYIEDLKRAKIVEIIERMSGEEGVTLNHLLEAANTEQTGLHQLILDMPLVDFQSLVGRELRRRPAAAAAAGTQEEKGERAARGSRLVPVLQALKEADGQGIRRGDLQEKLGWDPTVQLTHGERTKLITRTGSRGKFRYKITPEGENYLARVA